MYDAKREYEKNLKVAKNQIKVATGDIETLERELEFLSSTKSPNSKYRIDTLRRQIFERRYFIYILSKEMEYLRPSSAEDANYRVDVYNEFAEAVKETIPDDIPFRFHGTPIYFAKEILKSGEISCSEDRLGYSTSHDLKGHISVTTKETIVTTIGSYINITDFSMPAGCIFVLLPSEEDGRLISDQMKKVDFKRNPDVLVAIITTPENLPRLKSWCTKYQIDASKLCDFKSFVSGSFGPLRQYMDKTNDTFTGKRLVL